MFRCGEVTGSVPPEGVGEWRARFLFQGWRRRQVSGAKVDHKLRNRPIDFVTTLTKGQCSDVVVFVDYKTRPDTDLTDCLFHKRVGRFVFFTTAATDGTHFTSIIIA